MLPRNRTLLHLWHYILENWHNTIRRVVWSRVIGQWHFPALAFHATLIFSVLDSIALPRNITVSTSLMVLRCGLEGELNINSKVSFIHIYTCFIYTRVFVCMYIHMCIYIYIYIHDRRINVYMYIVQMYTYNYKHIFRYL